MVGLSDHTMGTEAPIIAVALGSRIVEKHFILSREMGGVDSHFSLDEKNLNRCRSDSNYGKNVRES